MSVQALIDFWKTPVISDSAGQYFHPRDKETLQNWISKATHGKQRTVHAHDQSHFADGQPRTGQLHLNLPPMPYVGNLKAAKVVIGMINPTVAWLDYEDNRRDDFQTLRARNLQQSEDRSFALDPHAEVKATSWSSYYSAMFKGFLDEYAAGASRQEAEEKLMLETAILELVPYYSQNATLITQTGLQQELASAQHALKAMKEFADRRDVLVICRWKSGLERWQLGSESHSATVACSKSRRGLGKDTKKALAAHMQL
ncbi:MAG: hypothetical protein ACRYGF_12665 [Janthinobacterium lividum]